MHKSIVPYYNTKPSPSMLRTEYSVVAETVHILPQLFSISVKLKSPMGMSLAIVIRLKSVPQAKVFKACAALYRNQLEKKN